MRWPWQRQSSPVDLGAIDEVISADVALASRLDPPGRARLVELAAHLVADKRWEAAAGFALTDHMIATIAANASIPILGLDVWIYRQVNSIIVHPTTTSTTGRRGGPAEGVESDAQMAIVGLAAPHSGPVSLSWDSVLSESRRPESGRNVVIHEFAHKIDMSDGAADGVPPLRGPLLGHWDEMLHDEYEDSKVQESDRALRPYAWTNKAEFFAVATEAFFCQPTILQPARPKLYACMADFYQQDPARWNPSGGAVPGVS